MQTPCTSPFSSSFFTGTHRDTWSSLALPLSGQYVEIRPSHLPANRSTASLNGMYLKGLGGKPGRLPASNGLLSTSSQRFSIAWVLPLRIRPRKLPPPETKGGGAVSRG